MSRGPSTGGSLGPAPIEFADGDSLRGARMRAGYLGEVRRHEWKPYVEGISCTNIAGDNSAPSMVTERQNGLESWGLVGGGFR